MGIKLLVYFEKESKVYLIFVHPSLNRFVKNGQCFHL